MFDIYLACLSNAALHRRTAVQIELAVGLCIAHDFAADPAEGRVMLTSVYASAGYNCLSPDGNDYKTVNRRVNTSFLLFDRVGFEPVHGAIARLAGHRRIEAIQGRLAPLELYTYDDVLAYCGRPRHNAASTVSASTAAPAPQRRADDQPGVVHVTSRHIDVSVPPAATRAEVMEIVVKLVALAETLNGVKRGRGRPIGSKNKSHT